MIDWPRHVDDLLQAGWGLRALACRWGCSEHQLWGLHIGRVDEPKYTVGVYVLRMHQAASLAGFFEPAPRKMVGRSTEVRDTSEALGRILMLAISPVGIANRVGSTAGSIYSYRNHISLTPAPIAERIEELLDRCERTDLFDIMCPPRPGLGRVLLEAV